MIWVKIPYMQCWNKPMDHKLNFIDGRRLFGDNKTWKGFFGMVIFAMVLTVIWGLICGNEPGLNAHNYLYRNHNNTFLYNGFMGFLLGLAYILFELPNSFLKRRINIIPGKRIQGPKGVFFVVFDQADSILGCVLVISFVYSMTIPFYFAYVSLGAATHIIINVLLYSMKLRKNMF